MFPNAVEAMTVKDLDQGLGLATGMPRVIFDMGGVANGVPPSRTLGKGSIAKPLPKERALLRPGGMAVFVVDHDVHGKTIIMP